MGRTLANGSNIAVGVVGAAVIGAAFFMSSATAIERVGDFFLGASMVLLSVYVFQISEIENPQWWQSGLSIISVVLGILIVLLTIFFIWFTIQLFKGITQAIGEVMGGR